MRTFTEDGMAKHYDETRHVNYADPVYTWVETEPGKPKMVQVRKCLDCEGIEEPKAYWGF